jgi:hypothetical protein
MNPYLENPELWPEVYSRLIVAIADALNPQLMPKYRAAIDQRVYDLCGDEALLIGIPEVTVGQPAAMGVLFAANHRYAGAESPLKAWNRLF